MVPGEGILRLGRLACLAAALAAPHASEASDPIAASRRLRERAGSLAPIPDFGTGITRDVGAIAIVEHDGSDYGRLEPDGTPNYAARARVSRRFYEDHGDLYDFVVIWTTFESDMGGALAFESTVRNAVRGIGVGLFNSAASYGSRGQLQSVVMMGNLARYPPRPDEQFQRSDRTTLAVSSSAEIMRTGMWRRSGSCLRRASTAGPSRSGIMTSSRTRSTGSR